MKSNNLQEATISGILIALLVAITNPLHLWMPDMVHLMVLAGVVVAFSLFAVFIFREKAVDERESTHRMLAGRVAFLSGSALLVVGIIYQSYSDTLDLWLVMVLVVMILAKVGMRLYSDRYF